MNRRSKSRINPLPRYDAVFAEGTDYMNKLASLSEEPQEPATAEYTRSLQPVVHVQRLDEHAFLPVYKTLGSAGLDLHAWFPRDVEYALLHPQGRLLVKTGLAVKLPSGFEGQIRPRSGLALTHGITVLNAPGTIDSDYRGEVCVILINHGPEVYPVKHGDRIAQLVIAPVAHAAIDEVAHLDETGRGSGGFGSTGR